jgi:methylmalonyl-CoA/ethylmalonyl-CoA epimerase
MLLTEIDHVAIAVRDLEAAIDYYQRAFGAEVDHREVVESDGVEEALLKVAESYIQLLTPTRDDSPVAKAIEKRGEGLHHIGYRVDDCAEALASMVAAGAIAIDQAPRPGSRGTTVAFIHPKGSFGTLIELVQEPTGTPSSASTCSTGPATSPSTRACRCRRRRSSNCCSTG